VPTPNRRHLIVSSKHICRHVSANTALLAKRNLTVRGALQKKIKIKLLCICSAICSAKFLMECMHTAGLRCNELRAHIYVYVYTCMHIYIYATTAQDLMRQWLRATPYYTGHFNTNPAWCYFTSGTQHAAHYAWWNAYILLGSIDHVQKAQNTSAAIAQQFLHHCHSAP